jgi:hypothetical protein
MTRGLRAPTIFICFQLTSSDSARISHRDVDILVGVIQLRIVSDLHIQPRKMEADGNVIEVALMMVSVSPLDHHFSPHNIWGESGESLQQSLTPLTHRL